MSIHKIFNSGHILFIDDIQLILHPPVRNSITHLTKFHCCKLQTKATTCQKTVIDMDYVSRKWVTSFQLIYILKYPMKKNHQGQYFEKKNSAACSFSIFTLFYLIALAELLFWSNKCFTNFVLNSLNSLEILICELLVASQVLSLKKISRHLLTYPVLQLHCASLTLLTSFAVTAIF